MNGALIMVLCEFSFFFFYHRVTEHANIATLLINNMAMIQATRLLCRLLLISYVSQVDLKLRINMH